MIPDFVWPFVAVGCLLLKAHLDVRRIKRRADRNWHAIESERKARGRVA